MKPNNTILGDISVFQLRAIFWGNFYRLILVDYNYMNKEGTKFYKLTSLKKCSEIYFVPL